MLDDDLLEELLTQSVAASTSYPDPLGRALRVLLLLALVPAVVLGLVGLLVGGAVVAVVTFVVVYGVVAGGGAAAFLRSSDSRAITAIGGRAADPVFDARLLNVVDGLCTATGIRPPSVRVVEADGLNAMAAGRHPSSATLVVTSRLVAELSRVELEGVLAEQVVNIRRGRMVAATVAASVPPLLARLIRPASSAEVEEDRAAVGLTRYPPGLIAALEKMQAKGTAVATPASLDALWMADPNGEPALVAPLPDTPGPPRLPLARRIEALAEL